jgi:membrane protein YqaA with SNARE-associated domain
MASIIELLSVLLISFGFNLNPFAGPSNLFIASNAVLVLSVTDPTILTDPTTLIIIGLLVAIGSSLAKSIHYLITFFVSKHLSQQRQERLKAEAEKTKKWAFLLLYAAAATPIPDEPIVIPLGLMKYSPKKFFTAFFLGKLTITIPGALLGAWGKTTFSEWLSPEAMIALSIILTIVVTVILLKVDFGKIAEQILRKIRRQPKQNTNQQPTGSPATEN